MTIKEARQLLSLVYQEISPLPVKGSPSPIIKKSNFDYANIKRDETKNTHPFRFVKKFFKNLVEGFTKKENLTLFNEQENCQKLIRRNLDPKTTYSPLPSLWPASEKQASFEWPYLMMERNKEEILKAPFNEKLTKLKPMKGRLMMSPSGHLYLKIPDSIISIALSFIQPERRNLCNLSSISFFGANVGVMLPHEIKRTSEGKILDEVGEEFYFSVRGCFTTKIKECSEVWFLTVDSPGLENIRRKYGLNPTPSFSAFSSVIAFSSSAGIQYDTLSIFDGFFRISPVAGPA